MGKHSVAEAKSQLSSLIDRALEGDEVIITRHGTPVVELRAVAKQGRVLTPEEFEYFRSRRIKPTIPGASAVDIIREMRDEGV